MKLEIKHLDFANNGKVRLTRLPHWDFENVNLQDCELHFNSSSKEPYLRYKDVTFGLDQIKVYKLPLSSLTKEIEHNGEKFVPMVELASMQYPEVVFEIVDGRCFGRLNAGVVIEFTIDDEIPFYKEYHNNIFGQSKSDDYDDTAALIAACDKVVGVNTTALHCAAALGVDTIALIPDYHQWRYARPSMMWYRHMRTVDQKGRQWREVMEQIARQV